MSFYTTYRDQLSKSRIPQRVWLAGAATLSVLVLVYLSSRPSPQIVRTVDHKAPANQLLLDDTQNATLGFQKIFAINLRTRTDHRDAMSLAAALTNLTIEYVDGVTEVSEKTLPPGNHSQSTKGELGNWRAHMNVARMIVEQGLSSALVLEDDADWDIRIKSQMREFALATRLLIQPSHLGVLGHDKFLDPTYPKTSGREAPSNFYIDSASTMTPTTSPYGDVHRWDMLWVGHCGTRFPSQEWSSTPLGRAVILNDVTVPEPQHVEMQYSTKELIEEYPPHTRVVHRANENLCTLGYALSNSGARHLLYELSLDHLDDPTDVSMRDVCDGKNGRPGRRCYSVQPQLFQHHRPVGNKQHESDISGHPDVINTQAFTRNIRWSTRLNFNKLLNGETDYIDLFKDGEQALDLGW